ncbi:hypothetical protein [Saccharothrix sp. ALI-22-I]|uniref:hypothetical protein n=1 Tax=Saccharothrix sp. ALI-22-I TaxID=1933778 RepID=UPI00117ADBAF|nr:hypothetical protein [Saccharothrix sp. ALI-22-I]
MTGRDDPVVHAVSGEVAVVSVTVLDPDPVAVPETEPEVTRPLQPLRGRRLWLADLMWTARRFARRDGLALRIAAVVLVLLTGFVLGRETEPPAPTRGEAAAASPSSPTSTPPATRARTPSPVAQSPAGVQPVVPDTQQQAALPPAIVGLEVPGALVDPAPTADPGTTVLHPVREAVVYREPGGPAFARLPATQVFAPTWVPVVERRPGWALVLLPARPHADGAAAAGWVHLDQGVELAEVDRRVVIDRAAGSVAVLADVGRVRLSSTTTPPPAGGAVRTFVAIGAAREDTSWLLTLLWPLVVPAGRLCSSPVGGIGVPGLPDTSPLGPRTSGGCVDVPEPLRDALRTVPAGAPVLLR